MRILCVNYEFPPVGGGGGNANYYLARELVKMGHEVTVVTSHFRGLPHEETVDGIRVKRVRVWRQSKQVTRLHEMLEYVVFAIPALIGLCRREEFHLIHVFFAVPSGPAGLVASWVARAPMIVRLGGGDLPGHDPSRFGSLHKMLRPAVGFLLSRAGARVANSEGLRQRARRVYPGLDFEVVHNGVDLERFSPSKHKTNGVPVILFVSRLIERKGLQFLLPALATIAERGIEFTLLVAGDGPMRRELQAQARRLRIDRLVEFIGFVNHDRLPEVYRNADIFVLPSLSEGMPNVVLEAIASGLPVVGTDVPGMAELIEEGENGHIVPPGDPAALEKALVELLADAARRRAYRAASRQRAQRFSWRKVSARYLRIYERCRRDANSLQNGS